MAPCLLDDGMVGHTDVFLSIVLTGKLVAWVAWVVPTQRTPPSDCLRHPRLGHRCPWWLTVLCGLRRGFGGAGGGQPPCEPCAFSGALLADALDPGGECTADCFHACPVRLMVECNMFSSTMA